MGRLVTIIVVTLLSLAPMRATAQSYTCEAAYPLQTDTVLAAGSVVDGASYPVAGYLQVVANPGGLTLTFTNTATVDVTLGLAGGWAADELFSYSVIGSGDDMAVAICLAEAPTPTPAPVTPTPHGTELAAASYELQVQQFSFVVFFGFALVGLAALTFLRRR